MKSEEKVRLALRCNVIAQVMFLDNNTATASHKARMHGPGWRTAHASSIDEKGLIVRQLPPRFVRVLLVLGSIILWVIWTKTSGSSPLCIALQQTFCLYSKHMNRLMAVQSNPRAS